MIKGSCLCGDVAFEIDGKVSPIGHCHCSLCRKVSGAGSNLVFLTAVKSLTWTKGEELKKKFSRPSGYGATFCTQCGSQLPNMDPTGKIYWVPPGVLDNDPGVKPAHHIFVGSMAPWDEITDDLPQHEEYPKEWEDQDAGDVEGV